MCPLVLQLGGPLGHPTFPCASEPIRFDEAQLQVVVQFLLGEQRLERWTDLEREVMGTVVEDGAFSLRRESRSFSSPTASSRAPDEFDEPRHGP
jgi:hypothetical protein